MKRVVLLGGGHAHLHVLQALAAERLRDARVVLATPAADAIYSGMVPGFVAGHYSAHDLTIALRPLAASAGVQFVADAATGIDASARRVMLAGGGSVEYDVLSIDIGHVIDRDAIAGAREHGLFVRPMERFVGQFESLARSAAQRAVDLAVVGGGAAGFELALALHHRLSRCTASQRSRVALVTGGQKPLAEYPPGVVRRGERALRRRGVSVFEQACARIEPDRVILADGTALRCDAAIVAIGASAPRWLAGSGLALDAQGFIATGPTLQSTSHPDVFAAGDVATRIDAPHPRKGVYAVRAGPPLARNLRRAVAGEPLETYRPQKRSLSLLSCGERHAIATWGGWSIEGDWVWRWKDRIDRAFIERYRKR